MEVEAVIERVQQVAAVRGDGRVDRVGVENALASLTKLRSWLDSSEADLARRLTSAVSFPEAAIAEKSRGTLGAASRTIDRSKTLDDMPKMAAALDDGAVTAGHVDVLTRAAKSLEPDVRRNLFERCESLVTIAMHATTAEFGRRVRDEARRISADDGMEHLEQQHRATSLRTWVDDDGMWNLRGRFDPVTGVRLASRLESAVETLFSEQAPPTCPSDPIERQHHLRALALDRLLTYNATGRKAGRPEYLVVIHTDATGKTNTGNTNTANTTGMAIVGGSPTVEWSIPVEVPWPVLAELATSDNADMRAVVVCNGVVLHAPGKLDLGRGTRLANRAQRRALRGLYSTCGVPGCATHYDRCKLHHVIWWRHGGRTDLANLIPVCSHHHHKIHDHGWHVSLGPNREITLTLPDGTIRNTGPPTSNAA